MTQTNTKYVVSRRTSGFGDCLISLMSAWYFAKQTGRTLVIDWRRSAYLKEKKKNAFSHFFEPVSEILGVPVICDDTVNDINYPGPVYSRFQRRTGLKSKLGMLWHQAFLIRCLYVLDYTDAAADETEIIHLARDVEEPTIVFRSCLPGGLPGRSLRQSFLAHIRLRGDIQEELVRFANSKFGQQKVIGVHIRHGNSGNLLNHARHWLDESRSLARILEEIQKLRKELGDDSRIFLCTDSKLVSDMMSSRLPQLIAHDKYFKPINTGELHARKTVLGTGNTEVGRDALIDMFLLARTDVLIAYPPDSYFSFYAKTIADGPIVRQIEWFETQTRDE